MAENFNWSLCMLCQKKRSGWFGNLKCPKSSKGATEQQKLEPYEQLHKNLKLLREAGINPDVTLPRHITARTMFDNDGKYHHNCHVKYTSSTLKNSLMPTKRIPRQIQTQQMKHKLPKEQEKLLLIMSAASFVKNIPLNPLVK